jgi:hypothetical protein
LNISSTTIFRPRIERLAVRYLGVSLPATGCVVWALRAVLANKIDKEARTAYFIGCSGQFIGCVRL